MIEEMGGTFDPQYIGKSQNLYIEYLHWPQSIKQKVRMSLKRYNEYINNEDHIRENEISGYRKEWITNSLAYVPENILKHNENDVRMIL